MRLDTLKIHPSNSLIYTPTDLSELKKSLQAFGQFEPIAVTKDGLIISGHRRFAAMKELGWETCDVRIIDPPNEIIALIEHNRTRVKSVQDILNEARTLEKELKKIVGRGRTATMNRDDTSKNKKMRVAFELASRLGIGTSRMKQLLSISNYMPELIPRIDKGELTVSSAYDIVQTKFMTRKNAQTKEKSFEVSLRKLLKDKTPKYREVMNILKRTYPYSLDATGLTEDRRLELIDHMDRLKIMDSRSYMLVQKKDELDYLNIDPKDIKIARSLLPSLKELETFFFKTDNPMSKVQVVQANGHYTCKKTGIVLTKQLWNCLRVGISSQEQQDGLGRRMFSFVAFTNDKGFRLLGLISLRSDSQNLGVRDSHIGWETDIRAKNREHLVNMSVCVPTSPFGNAFLGGKFVAMCSKRMIGDWEKHYKMTIAAVLTTSLHGSFSQYSGMKYWKNLGTTSGSMIIKPLRQEWSFWKDWLREHYNDLYEENVTKTSPTQGVLSSIFTLLDIPKSVYTHNHHRGVFIMPLYENYIEFLNDRIKTKDLVSVADDWGKWWLHKAKDRWKKVKTEGRVSDDKLFHEAKGNDELEMLISVSGTN